MHVAGPLAVNALTTTVTIPASLLAAGTNNIIAVEVKNSTGTPGTNPTSLDYQMVVT